MITIVGAEVDGRIVDVRIAGGLIEAVGERLDRVGEIVDAAGAALLPGLHDHHIHLLAMAAAARSLDASVAASPEEFDRLVAGSRLNRVVDYDEHRHGPLDRARLDTLSRGRPVRVQHRSGVWVVDGPRAEEPVDLAPVAARLASYGVTGVTDATPFTDPAAFDLLASTPQRVFVTGAASLAATAAPDGLGRGPVKVVVADAALPPVEEVVAQFRAARRAGRAVAVHCVTASALAIALAAWDETGAVDGDRVEHGSVIPAEAVPLLRDLGLCVVTQPGFVADRGDRYLDLVDDVDQPDLYRCRSLLDAGVAVAGSTDAPFGPDDPWVAMRAAAERRDGSGAIVGAGEAVSARRALGLFLGAPDRPGGPERQVEVGAPADLCLLHLPLADGLRDLSQEIVRTTFIAGEIAPA